MTPTETLQALLDRWREDLRKMRQATDADHAARTTKELCLRELDTALKEGRHDA